MELTHRRALPRQAGGGASSACASSSHAFAKTAPKRSMWTAGVEEALPKRSTARRSDREDLAEPFRQPLTYAYRLNMGRWAALLLLLVGGAAARTPGAAAAQNPRAAARTLGAAAEKPLHATCRQPAIGGQNVSFWTGAAFAAAGSGPQVLLSMGSVGKLHVPPVLGLSISPAGDGCRWFVPAPANQAYTLSEPRTSGCATAYGRRIAFAGGHNNSAAYVGTVDVFERSAGGRLERVRTLQLPVGRELLGCATAANVSIFAGGKPPHCAGAACPPGVSPIGETKEIDVWEHTTDRWLPRMSLSVPRKKVEALAVGRYILMAGGEIGRHPPVTGEVDARAASYSSTVLCRGCGGWQGLLRGRLRQRRRAAREPLQPRGHLGQRDRALVDGAVEHESFQLDGHLRRGPLGSLRRRHPHPGARA
eukprot:COSAG04_NODE_5010_length_1783_cov_1.226247_2_plen_421_part_00